MNSQLIVTLVFTLSEMCAVNSARILAAFPFPSKSHFGMQGRLVKDLVDNGHHVTAITAYTLEGFNLGENYTEILIEPMCDLQPLSHQTCDWRPYFFQYGTTECALQHPKVQAIVNAKVTEGVYDLLLAAQFFQEAFLALAYKYNIPVVTCSTLGFELYMSQIMGAITPWSFVPNGMLPFTEHMHFWERLQNSFYSLYEDLYREFVYFPEMDAITQKYFSHLPITIPKVTDMEKNISLMLLNSHAPLTSARPVVNTMISVGGMHIDPPKPLPHEIQNFLDEATHGAIYFSFGTQVQSKDMPPETLKVFLEVFSGLKQRVLWKFEDESMVNVPKNMMIQKWMPQADILGHPNVKVFISHGGLFGTMEAVHFGVPMLGIPFYSDQHINTYLMQKKGYGIKLPLLSITKDTLRESLVELLQNPTYMENIKKASSIFRDRPMQPRQTALYWMEYVIRHNGTKHIRSAALDLKWYQRYLLDVIGFVLVMVLLAMMILVTLLNRICKRSKRPNKTKKD